MAESPSPEFSQYGIENTSIPTAAGVLLDAKQQLLTGSVLDLFAGRPSLRKLTLWTDNASFVDPLTIAEGRKQYQAQWYGLKAVFSNIERLSCNVTSGGQPIEMDLKTKYTVKGLGSEQIIASKVLIHTSADGSKIEKVEDKWNGKLPDGVFTNVSVLSLRSWVYYAQSWGYSIWVQTLAEMLPGRVCPRPFRHHFHMYFRCCRHILTHVLQALRNLNSVTVPVIVSVPKSIEEEEVNMKKQ